MTKTLTEQWRDGEWIVCNAGKCDYYYTDVKCYNGSHKEVIKEESVFLTDYDPDYEILGKVPSYDEVKEMSQKIERLEFDNEALEMAHNEGKEINAELISKTDEFVQKIHILNEQNTKQYNELCEEIKKNNILEKRLEIATKALKEYADRTNWIEGNFMCVYDGKSFADEESADKALKEMEGVK